MDVSDKPRCSLFCLSPVWGLCVSAVDMIPIMQRGASLSRLLSTHLLLFVKSRAMTNRRLPPDYSEDRDFLGLDFARLGSAVHLFKRPGLNHLVKFSTGWIGTINVYSWLELYSAKIDFVSSVCLLLILNVFLSLSNSCVIVGNMGDNYNSDLWPIWLLCLWLTIILYIS